MNNTSTLHIKKAPDSRSKQSGFFDLGISLLVLGLSGSAVYATEGTGVEKNASLQESTRVTASQQTENTKTKLARTDSDTPAFVLQ
jgi:hypothetical protein